MAETASCLINFFRSHDHSGGILPPVSRDTLRAGRRASTNHADRREFGDVLGDRQQFWHRAEGLPSEVHVQPGDKDLYSPVSQLLDYLNQGFVKELGFINAYDPGVIFHQAEDLIRLPNRAR